MVGNELSLGAAPWTQLGLDDWGLVLPPALGGHTKAHIWHAIGRGTDFLLKRYAMTDAFGNTDKWEQKDIFQTAAYAIHRPIGGKKPYLWLRKKYYPLTTQPWLVENEPAWNPADPLSGIPRNGANWYTPFYLIQSKPDIMKIGQAFA